MMKTIVVILLLVLPGLAVSGERHVVFDSPGNEGSDWKWVPVTLSDSESELLSKRSDPPKTALDYYLLISGKYFRNIASETARRITFIERGTLSDQYLHAKYTIPAVDAGGFWITIRLFGDREDPLIAISHRGGTKRLLAAKQNGPQGLWSVGLNRPSLWRFRGGAYSEGGGFFRVSDSVMPELSIDQILDHYRDHYVAEQGEAKTIWLSYTLPQEGNTVKVTKESLKKMTQRHVWAEFIYRGDKFESLADREKSSP